MTVVVCLSSMLSPVDGARFMKFMRIKSVETSEFVWKHTKSEISKTTQKSILFANAWKKSFRECFWKFLYWMRSDNLIPIFFHRVKCQKFNIFIIIHRMWNICAVAWLGIDTSTLLHVCDARKLSSTYWRIQHKYTDNSFYLTHNCATWVMYRMWSETAHQSLRTLAVDVLVIIFHCDACCVRMCVCVN